MNQEVVAAPGVAAVSYINFKGHAVARDGVDTNRGVAGIVRSFTMGRELKHTRKTTVASA